MEPNLPRLIGQLAFRVRLFMESTGRGVSSGNLGERDLLFLEYLEKKGDVSFSELAGFFQKVSASTVSNTLKKLYNKGLVTRRDDPDDLRAKIFAITPDGVRLLQPVKQAQAEVFQVIVDNLKLTPEEAKVVAGILPRAVRNFNIGLGFEA